MAEKKLSLCIEKIPTNYLLDVFKKAGLKNVASNVPKLIKKILGSYLLYIIRGSCMIAHRVGSSTVCVDEIKHLLQLKHETDLFHHGVYLELLDSGSSSQDGGGETMGQTGFPSEYYGDTSSYIETNTKDMLTSYGKIIAHSFPCTNLSPFPGSTNVQTGGDNQGQTGMPLQYYGAKHSMQMNSANNGPYGELVSSNFPNTNLFPYPSETNIQTGGGAMLDTKFDNMLKCLTSVISNNNLVLSGVCIKYIKSLCGAYLKDLATNIKMHIPKKKLDKSKITRKDILNVIPSTF